MLDNFLYSMQQRVAYGSIPVSTVRNMGPSDTMAQAQRFLSNPELLERFRSINSEVQFVTVLDEETTKLRNALPISIDGKRGRYWGTARKCINIFLYESLLNSYLREAYSLHRLEGWLEVPLDRLVGTKLRNDAKSLGIKLPSWDGVIYVDELFSNKYQDAALKIAELNKIARVHLELIYFQAD